MKTTVEHGGKQGGGGLFAMLVRENQGDSSNLAHFSRKMAVSLIICAHGLREFN